MEMKKQNENTHSKKLKHYLICMVGIIGAIFNLILPMHVNAEESTSKYHYEFTYTTKEYKYNLYYDSNTPCVLYMPSGQMSSHLNKYQYMFYNGDGASAALYQLSSDKTTVNVVYPKIASKYRYNQSTGDFTERISSATGMEFKDGIKFQAYNHSNYKYHGFINSLSNNLKLLVFPAHEMYNNLTSYLNTGKLTTLADGMTSFELTNAKFIPFSGMCNNGGYSQTETDSSLSVYDLKINNDGILTYTVGYIPNNVYCKGINIYIGKDYEKLLLYRVPFGVHDSIKLNLGNMNSTFNKLTLQPYYVKENGQPLVGKISSIALDSTAEYYTRVDKVPFIPVQLTEDIIGTGIKPGSDNDYIGGSSGGSTSGIESDLNADADARIEIPKIVMDSSGYKFGFNNGSNDVYFELMGRWYSVDDIELYKDNLMWKYKYKSIIKNDLSTWVTTDAQASSTQRYDLTQLGKASFESLLSKYPVDNRSYTGGSNAIGNYFSGYSDAMTTLKMLLNTSTSVYNSPEIYVRYWYYDKNGEKVYSKWTHFYSNLAKETGSSGSTWDDKENIFTSNQSQNGLETDDITNLESTGNSRNDTDAKPSYSSNTVNGVVGNDASDNIANGLSGFMESFTALQNTSTGLLGFINHTFSFLPWWCTTAIAGGIVLVVIIGIVKALRG